MNNNIINFIDVSQKLYRLSKPNKKLLLRGETAILLFISMNEMAVNPSDISLKFDISTARVAKILNGLEKKELIERKVSETDKRVTNIILTPKGRNLSLNIKNEHISFLTNLFESLGEEDTKHINRILNKIYVILKEDELC